MSDFIREVDEDYRRDRIIAFVKRYWVALAGLAVLVVVATAAYRVYLHYRTEAAEAGNARYAAAMQLARDGKGAEAQEAFDAIQRSGPPGYATLARMKAVETVAGRDPAAGARGFDAIADDEGFDATFRDLARLRAAVIRVDTDDPAAFEKRYAPFAADGFSFHASMRELLALAAFKRDDSEAAGRWLDQIVTDPGAPGALRKRAEAFLSLVAAGPAAPAAAMPASSVPAVPGPADPGVPAPAASELPAPAEAQ